MKKIILSVAVILAFGAIGCKSSGDDPKVVVANFLEALSKKDFETAKKYATTETIATLDMLKGLASMGMKEDDKVDKFDRNDYIFGEPKITGDLATVEVKNKKNNDVQSVNLKKESDGWKVAFDKAGMMKQGMEKMKEKGMDMNDMNKGMDSATKMLEDMNSRRDTTSADTTR